MPIYTNPPYKENGRLHGITYSFGFASNAKTEEQSNFKEAFKNLLLDKIGTYDCKEESFANNSLIIKIKGNFIDKALLDYDDEINNFVDSYTIINSASRTIS